MIKAFRSVLLKYILLAVVVSMANRLINNFKKNSKLISLSVILFMSVTSIIFLSGIDERQLKTATEAPSIREPNLTASKVTSINTFEAFEPKNVKVILARIYLDGEVSEEIIEETIWSMEDFWAEYEEWDLVDQDDVQVVFQQKVDDISPLLKINGYFGISEEGILNIYDGNPSDDKVIQSFFQINMKELKSQQHQELQKGIPILSRDRYEEVLKTYKKYAKKEM